MTAPVPTSEGAAATTAERLLDIRGLKTHFDTRDGQRTKGLKHAVKAVTAAGEKTSAGGGNRG